MLVYTLFYPLSTLFAINFSTLFIRVLILPKIKTRTGQKRELISFLAMWNLLAGLCIKVEGEAFPMNLLDMRDNHKG